MLKASIALTSPLAHARIAVSAGVADDLATLSGISRQSITVIYNPLLTRPETEADIAAAENVWCGWRGPRIITVGRFKAVKNHALLIRAFKKVLEIRDARLLILGTGELVEATVAFARKEGVADKVIMPGSVPNPAPYYRSSDLFALSSDHEGFSVVIIEALACGVPVVSTDCPSGPSEILENGRYGRLVPVGDADALARAMADALTAKHDREALKRLRRFRARTHSGAISGPTFSEVGRRPRRNLGATGGISMFAIDRRYRRRLRKRRQTLRTARTKLSLSPLGASPLSPPTARERGFCLRFRNQKPGPPFASPDCD